MTVWLYVVQCSLLYYETVSGLTGEDVCETGELQYSSCISLPCCEWDDGRCWSGVGNQPCQDAQPQHQGRYCYPPQYHSPGITQARGTLGKQCVRGITTPQHSAGIFLAVTGTRDAGLVWGRALAMLVLSLTMVW